MALLPIDIQTQNQKKIIFHFRYLPLFFLTNLIFTDQVDKNMDRSGILWPFRKWAYFPTISKPGAKKTYFRFRNIILYFF